MGLYMFGGDHDLYVEGSNIMIDNRGHRTVYKRFHSEAEAEAYMRRLIGKEKCDTNRQMNEKHRKSHRPRHIK